MKDPAVLFYTSDFITGTLTMTDLTALDYLVKTDKRRPGEYDKLNYCWKLA